MELPIASLTTGNSSRIRPFKCSGCFSSLAWSMVMATLKNLQWSVSYNHQVLRNFKSWACWLAYFILLPLDVMTWFVTFRCNGQPNLENLRTSLRGWSRFMTSRVILFKHDSYLSFRYGLALILRLNKFT